MQPPRFLVCFVALLLLLLPQSFQDDRRAAAAASGAISREEFSLCSPPPDYLSNTCRLSPQEAELLDGVDSPAAADGVEECEQQMEGEGSLGGDENDDVIAVTDELGDHDDEEEKDGVDEVVDSLLAKEEDEGFTDGWRKLFCKFHNSVDPPRDIRMFFEHTDPNEKDIDYGIVKPGVHKDLTSYLGNKIYAVDEATGQRIAEAQVNMEERDYYFVEKVVVDPKEKEQLKEKEAQFKKEYLERTGRKWINVYPRGPTIHHIYQPVEVGHIHKATSRHFFWHRGMEEFPGDDEPSLEFELETLSVSPKVFAVRNVMSEDEADYIKELAFPKLKRSVVTTKGVVSPVRTSSNSWLPTTESAVIKNIYSRIADITKLEEEFMAHDMAAENLQVVYYNTTQQYKEHHDYLEPHIYKDSENVQKGHNRLFTFLFYLNDVEEGGQTAFPKSDSPTGKETKFILPKGSAVLFYSMLEDGNLDFKSQHAGRPPIRGEKWIANLWVWDPRWL